MSVPCHVCHVGAAPNEQGKCSECAALAVDEWRRERDARVVRERRETKAERKLRLGRLSDEEYRAAVEGEES